MHNHTTSIRPPPQLRKGPTYGQHARLDYNSRRRGGLRGASWELWSWRPVGAGEGLFWSGDPGVRSAKCPLAAQGGWEPGAEPSEESCEHSHSEWSDPASETLVGSTSPGYAFGDAFEPQSSSEKLVGLLGDVWTKSASQKADVRQTPGHREDAPVDQSGCESGAFRSSPSVWPDGTWEEKTPSEEKFGPLDGPETEPPRRHTGRTSSKCRECGKMFQSTWALEPHGKSHSRNTPFTCSDCGKAFSRSSAFLVHLRVHIQCRGDPPGSTLGLSMEEKP
ncbi:zinc finger and SCAN domain-containing protein 22 [Artibeus jamaicensis]|uniref:zinc finger and SCAN domain-containing protein 22 n=1 Tax=Artibeus jamaicensis TaxID=9417 RepID=UPI00235ABF94|nr:zinc finger and SCAN domain-containing protein 22 [Artibeus jamaicensis]